MARTEYVIIDNTHVYWPGALPYKNQNTKLGRGYRTREEAGDRMDRVIRHYNATVGRSPGELTVIERQVGK